MADTPSYPAHCTRCGARHTGTRRRLARGWAYVTDRAFWCPGCYAKQPRLKWPGGGS